MSGHSKWSTIKRKKGAEDAKRGKIFTRLGREIVQAAREGGGDENANAKLRLAIQKARAANMPKENIERAILKGTGKLEGADMEEITFEAYGAEGVGIVIDVLTDNKNRTLGEMKRVFNKFGGNMASVGSVLWQFEHKGAIILKGDAVDFDEVFMVAAEAGADDVVNEDGVVVVYTPREQFAAVEEALAEAGYEIDESELKWISKNETEVALEKAIQNLRIMSELEELDDVQSVSSNLMMTDEALNAFETA
ncbi:MAG: YebC/PmpR family DNA-binding transcriptional regulator [Anaerolineae bacterium]|nr:YebC/PmpR family DNA-binding transcriptional regulator [Anaerolineae bacterium]